MTLSVPVPCVGVVCLRGDEALLIRRSKPPRQGDWSIPGGRIEWREPVREAALRELKEETGVEAELTGLIDVVDGIFPGEPGHYVLVDYAARWIAGEPRAGDDAAEAAFHPIADIDRLVQWPETRRIIRAAAALLKHLKPLLGRGSHDLAAIAGWEPALPESTPGWATRVRPRFPSNLGLSRSSGEA